MDTTTFPEPAGAEEGMGLARRRHRQLVGLRWDNPMMKLLVLTTMFSLNIVVAGTAGADPTAPPSPYQIAGPSGPVYGGMRTLPPICGAQPRACAGDWDPNSGTWVFPPGT
jgi:hypothetical protein